MVKKLFLLMLLSMLVVSPLFAIDVQEDGSRVGGAATNFNFTGDVNVSGNARTKTIDIGGESSTVEVVTTNDTITAADDGTRFVYTGINNITVTLPTAASGLQYTFIDGGLSNKSVIVDPATTLDTITYIALDGGDKINSPGITGDSLTIIGGTNVWYIIEMGAGAWTDGGA